jgi:hypothetical protein
MGNQRKEELGVKDDPEDWEEDEDDDALGCASV